MDPRQQPTYAAITPARNEAANLARLAPCMISQEVRPKRWIIVDNGSTDDTAAIAKRLAGEHGWISLVVVGGAQVATRGAPVVRAFHSGLDALEQDVEVIVKLDADVSFGSGYFAAQLDAFGRDPRLGISSGACLEPREDGSWLAARVTRGHVRGAVRAYRRECLEEIGPLEERMGWDGIDELKAQVRGWHTSTIPDLRFHHHRPLGFRERGPARWWRQGEMAHFMGYRPSYLIARTLYHVSREPSAATMLLGYAACWAAGIGRCSDRAALDHLRAQQRLREMPRRIAEKLGSRV